jgi:hypothetical protein
MLRLTSLKHAAEVGVILSGVIDIDSALIIVGMLMKFNRELFAGVKEFLNERHPYVYGIVQLTFDIRRNTENDDHLHSMIMYGRSRCCSMVASGVAAVVLADKYNIPEGISHVRCKVSRFGQLSDA